MALMRGVVHFRQDLSTERSSVGCCDAFLTETRRAEAFARTEYASSVETSSHGEEAMDTTQPLKKPSSPGRLERELTSCSRDKGEGVAAASDFLVCLARVTASRLREAVVAVAFPALSTSSSSRCIRRRRSLLRSVVSLTRSRSFSKRPSSSVALREPSRASRSWDDSRPWRTAELGEPRR